MINSIIKLVSEISHFKKYFWYIFYSELKRYIGIKSVKSRLFERVYAVDNEPGKYKFLKWAYTNINNSQSADYQDLLILYKTDRSNPDNTFLELGGCDGIYKSNCYLLEKNAWNGIVVEANPFYYSALTQNRNRVIKAAVTSRNIDQIMLVFDESKPSSGSVQIQHFNNTSKLKKIFVQTIRIESLIEIFLEKFPQGATYISLDIEGDEELILGQLIYKLKPKFISIEHNNNLQKMDIIYEVTNLYNYYQIYKGLTRNEFIFTN